MFFFFSFFFFFSVFFLFSLFLFRSRFLLGSFLWGLCWGRCPPSPSAPCGLWGLCWGRFSGVLVGFLRGFGLLLVALVLAFGSVAPVGSVFGVGPGVCFWVRLFGSCFWVLLLGLALWSFFGVLLFGPSLGSGFWVRLFGPRLFGWSFGFGLAPVFGSRLLVWSFGFGWLRFWCWVLVWSSGLVWCWAFGWLRIFWLAPALLVGSGSFGFWAFFSPGVLCLPGVGFWSFFFLKWEVLEPVGVLFCSDF